MNAGIFVTFRNEGEPAALELPPVGPLEQLVIRHRTLLCERTTVQQADDTGIPIERWLEAELELQRAMGVEPGGMRRTHLRVGAREGVLVRFAVFGDPSEREPVPELGPFAVVHVGRHTIEADGQVLATRSSSDIAPWELSSAAGPDHAGRSKADVAFRTPATAYHPSIASTPSPGGAAPEAASPPPPATPPPATPPPATPPPEVLPPPREPEPTHMPPAAPSDEPRRALDMAAPAPETHSPPRASDAPAPPSDEPAALTRADLELITRIERDRAEETLRARMQEEERRRLGVTADADDAASTWAMRYRTGPADETAAAVPGPEYEFDLRDLLWRLRFAIVGLLLLGAGFYGFMVVQGGGPTSVGPGGGSVRTVGIAQTVRSDNWEYVVNGTQRVQQAGNATASGVYYVVRIGVTNRRAEGLSLSPGEFALIDDAGTRYAPLGTASGVYQDSNNTGSPYIWPRTFPVGTTVTVGLVFDVPPSLGRGLQLTLPDLPSVRVKLD